MKIQELLKLYAKSAQVGALADVMGKKRVKSIFLEGLMCSSAPMVFAAMMSKAKLSLTSGQSVALQSTTLFILQDAEEAGYFYHDY